jgi:hypothetical protein
VIISRKERKHSHHLFGHIRSMCALFSFGKLTLNRMHFPAMGGRCDLEGNGDPVSESKMDEVRSSL